MIELAKTFIGIDVKGKLELMDYYNANCFKLVKPTRRYKIQPNDNWCAMFTSVIAHKMGLSPDKFPYEVSVGEQVKLGRERASFTQNMERAERGDLIIFNWNGDAWPDHVGFIDSINKGIITTVEGNFRKTVGQRNIAMNSPFIVGVIKY